MANKLAIIGLPNAIGQASVTVAAGTTAATGMPLTNLTTEEPSDLCRLETVDPAKTWWQFTLGYPVGGDGYNWPIRGAGLVNHNLERVSEFRVMLFARGASSSYQNLPPSAIALSSGWSGAATDIDEDPFAADGTAGVISTASGYVLLDFATPTRRVVGTKKHLVIIRAKASSAKGCTFAAYAQESGVTRVTLGEGQALGTDYRNYVFAFDPTTVSDLAAFQLKIVGTGDVGSGGKTMSVDAVRWQADVSSDTPVADSGWLAAPLPAKDATFGSTYADELGVEPTLSFSHFFASDAATGVVEIHVRNLRVEPDMVYVATAAASGYTQAGCAVAGPAAQPAYAPALGDVLAVRDASSIGYTLGGASYGSARRRRRVAPLQLRALSAAEGWGLFERLDWMAGTRGAVLISLFPDATDQSKRLGTFWATLEELSALTRPALAGGLLAKSYTFVEKL